MVTFEILRTKNIYVAEWWWMLSYVTDRSFKDDQWYSFNDQHVYRVCVWCQHL